MIELGARHVVAWLAASRSLTRRLGPSTGGLGIIARYRKREMQRKAVGLGKFPSDNGVGRWAARGRCEAALSAGSMPRICVA